MTRAEKENISCISAGFFSVVLGLLLLWLSFLSFPQLSLVAYRDD